VRVIRCLDCGPRGYRLGLENGEEVKINAHQFAGWNAAHSPLFTGKTSKDEFIESWNTFGNPPFYYSPKKDITVWELAQLMELLAGRPKKSVVHRLDEGCFRHISLLSSRQAEKQNQSESTKAQGSTSSDRDGLLSCLSRFLRRCLRGPT
jgi:hypothetical protein